MGTGSREENASEHSLEPRSDRGAALREKIHAFNRTFHRRQRGQGHVRADGRRFRADDRRRPGQGGAGLQGRGSRRRRERQGRPGRMGQHQSAAPRARDDEVPRTGAARLRQARRHAGARARQDRSRRQGRHPARPRSRRIRLRHPASDEGRIHRRRRPRHRHLFDAPAAWASSPASRRSISRR